MTTPQRKTGSAFGHRTTAEEVLRGIDLSGRLAIVTGGYSGLGLETTRTLSRAGAHVVVPARRRESARHAVEDLAGVEVDDVDLADLDTARAFSERFLATGRSVDLVIAGAGIMACPETRVGRGWEAHFATNHLGHFALVNLLWPAIVRDGGARVVSVSSAAHHLTGMRWQDVQFEHGYDRWLAYGQSKTANVLFAVHLDAIGEEHGVRAFSVHPGSILTPLQRHMTKHEMIAAGWLDDEGNLADPKFKTPQQGAATQVWAATSPQLEGIGGLYCEDCDVAEPAPPDGADAGVCSHAVDPDEAARLWDLSTDLTEVATPAAG